MPSLEERVAALEGRIQEQGIFMTDLRASGAELHQSVRAFGEGAERRFADLREEINRRFAELDRRFVELREEMNHRFEEMDRRFAWLVGIVITGFVTVIGTIAGAFWGVLQIVRSL